MKNLRKTLALVLCIAMVACLMTTAFASEPTTPTAVITAPENNHTYAIYQIFTGDLANGKLSNVKWGANGTGTPGTAVDESTLADVAAITGTDAAMAAAIAEYADLSSNPVGTVTNKGTATVPTGYYLIKDLGVAKDDGSYYMPDGQGYSLYVVKIVKDVTISPKTGTTSSEKKVKDDEGANTDWNDSADYDIGDDVPFQLKATVASDFANYKNGYKLTFHDKESAGLTFNAGSVEVYVGENSTTPIDASNYTVVTEGLTDGCTFEVHFEDLTKVAGVSANTVIRVEYTSTLNEHAVIGEAGNPNTSHITYTNNPNDTQAGENGKTPDDTVIVFTYKVVVNKVDQNNNPLAGAKFTLYKKNAEGEYVALKELEAVAVKGEEGETVISYTASFEGLDAGEYKLSETVTPAGYNTVADIEFTITATHSTEAAAPKLLTLDGGDLFTGEVTTGTLTTEVENKAGTTLPETGGIGTTLFYVIGGILVAGAGILLITKRRMLNVQ